MALSSYDVSERWISMDVWLHYKRNDFSSELRWRLNLLNCSVLDGIRSHFSTIRTDPKPANTMLIFFPAAKNFNDDSKRIIFKTTHTSFTIAEAGLNLSSNAFDFTVEIILAAVTAPISTAWLCALFPGWKVPSLSVTEALHGFPFGRIVHQTSLVDSLGFTVKPRLSTRLVFPCFVPCSTNWKVTGSVTIGDSPSGTGSRSDGSSFVECDFEDVPSV